MVTTTAAAAATLLFLLQQHVVMLSFRTTAATAVYCNADASMLLLILPYHQQLDLLSPCDLVIIFLLSSAPAPAPETLVCCCFLHIRDSGLAQFLVEARLAGQQ
jgi:hypothetical protein